MNIFLGILAGIVVVLIIILTAKIKIFVIAEKERFDLKVKLLFLTFDLSRKDNSEGETENRNDVSGNGLYEKIKKIAKSKGQEREEVSGNDEYTSVREKIYKVRSMISSFRVIFEKVLGYLSKHLKIRRLVFKMRFGTGDAASTGIEYGLLWGALGSIVAILNNYFKVYEQTVEITPDFNNKVIDFYGESIIETRIVHIIIAAIIVLFIYIFKGNAEN